MLWVVGITTADKPSQPLMAALNSFRASTEADLASFHFDTIELEDASPAKPMTDYVDAEDRKDSEARLLEILNGVDKGKTVSGGKFVKTISRKNLTGK